nr:sugar transport protein 7 isoform X2 [Ipomoea batatas]
MSANNASVIITYNAKEAAAMPGGAFVGSDKVGKARAEQYQGRVTCYVVVACMVAAGDGSLFGYFGYSPL